MDWTGSDTISAVAAFLLLIAIVVSLCIGINTLKQNKKLLIFEYKNRLLNEIVDWAMDIKMVEQKYIRPFADLTANELKQDLDRMWMGCEVLATKGIYIVGIAVSCDAKVVNAGGEALLALNKLKITIGELIMGKIDPDTFRSRWDEIKLRDKGQELLKIATGAKLAEHDIIAPLK